MYIMFDSVDLTQIPKNAHAVAGYVGGEWPTDSHDALRKEFRQAFVVSIAVQATQRASFLDVENGDALPGQAREWMDESLAAGQIRPGLYSSQYTMSIIKPMLRGIPRSKYRLWVAAPNGIGPAYKLLKQGYGACQFDWHYLGRDLDASLCDPWFFTANEHPLYTQA